MSIIKLIFFFIISQIFHSAKTYKCSEYLEVVNEKLLAAKSTIQYTCLNEVKISSGSFGDVYKLTDNENNIRAMKLQVLSKTDEERIKIVEAEVEYLQSLSSIYVVKLVHFVRVEMQMDFEYIMIMEYLDSGSLSDRIQTMRTKDKLFSTDELMMFTWHMLKALQYLDSKGIVHVDLKPENIMFKTATYIHPIDCQERTSEVPVIIDFGLSEKVGNPITHRKGTKLFIEPVLLFDRRGYYSYDRIDPMTKYISKMDLYALGITLYLMSHNNRPPYTEEYHNAFMRALVNFDYIIRRELNFGVIFLITNMMNIDSETRMGHDELIKYAEVLIRAKTTIRLNEPHTYDSRFPVKKKKFEEVFGFTKFGSIKENGIIKIIYPSCGHRSNERRLLKNSNNENSIVMNEAIAESELNDSEIQMTSENEMFEDKANSVNSKLIFNNKSGLFLSPETNLKIQSQSNQTRKVLNLSKYKKSEFVNYDGKTHKKFLKNQSAQENKSQDSRKILGSMILFFLLIIVFIMVFAAVKAKRKQQKLDQQNLQIVHIVKMSK